MIPFYVDDENNDLKKKSFKMLLKLNMKNDAQHNMTSSPQIFTIKILSKKVIGGSFVCFLCVNILLSHGTMGEKNAKTVN